jgi:hypothetical protein
MPLRISTKYPNAEPNEWRYWKMGSASFAHPLPNPRPHRVNLTP